MEVFDKVFFFFKNFLEPGIVLLISYGRFMDVSVSWVDIF